MTLAPCWSRRASSDDATVATTSSRVWRSSSVRSSTSRTSITRSSCLRTWSASAWPWSISSVTRERPACLVGPTEMPRTWNPRRRIAPASLVSVLGPSSTTTERTRTFSRDAAACGRSIVSGIVGGLPEFVQRLAEGHDRVDVRLGVDAEVDQERPGRALGRVEGRRDVLEALHAPRGKPVRLAELDEVRNVREVHLRAHAAVEVVLELADHAEREVVEEHDLDVEPVLDRDRQLLRGHHEPALAGDAPHGRLGARELGAYGGGKGEAHRPRAARVDEQPRPVVVPPQRRPDLVLAHVGRSEERRVGKECRARWERDHEKKKKGERQV